MVTRSARSTLLPCSSQSDAQSGSNLFQYDFGIPCTRDGSGFSNRMSCTVVVVVAAMVLLKLFTYATSVMWHNAERLTYSQ